MMKDDFETDELKLIGPEGRFKIASSKKAHRKVLERLSQDRSPAVRLAVAKNNRTPVEVLEKLCNDSEEMVRHEARKTLSKKKSKEPEQPVKTTPKKPKSSNPIFSFIEKESTFDWHEVEAEECAFTHKSKKSIAEADRLVKRLQKEYGSEYSFARKTYYRWVEIQWNKNKDK